MSHAYQTAAVMGIVLDNTTMPVQRRAWFLASQNTDDQVSIKKSTPGDAAARITRRTTIPPT